ncbi:MAG: CoA ester lyase [Microcystis aeruginosa Ma_MB_S_20031200_S102]|uniref:CoA ester lyase n=1 Tax=Microcystis aeruginosa Ma_MB_S_20031200_S102 TaxID=2486254 RepID=A0A552EUS6_MICAE|nr:MAG: CoA ester lyase [Microcystis aeruginosa Ma_MB_S_20031200_S102D]TRU38227.1 MAG: CoA ester lyase [Microcystis aeruginosa Ma_MB_S_20031200_S102]
MLHQSQKSLLALKSWLFTPATKSDRFSRAAEVKADALIIDLEDAVASTAKEEARTAALRYLGETSSNHLPCALRINSPDTRFGLDDLQALLLSPAEPDYLILPKCDSSALISLVGNLLREANKSTQVIALIESTKAIGALAEMVSGQIRPAAFIFGAADMAADLGAETAWEPLLWVRSCLIHAAASAGIAAFDSPYFDIADSEGLKQETKASVNLGFHGKCAIHPVQIATINEVLTPTAQQIAKAQQILTVNRQGVGAVEGQMVDEAVARKARLVLERAGIAAEE